MQEKIPTQHDLQPDDKDQRKLAAAGYIGDTALTPDVLIRNFGRLRDAAIDKTLTDLNAQPE